MPSPVLFWFRRDLRLQSNEALAKAARVGPVIPVFVLDEELVLPSGANRLAFLHSTLRSLNDSTGDRLVVRKGRPADVLRDVADEAGATQVFATDDFGPYGRGRDTEVGEYLATRGIATHYRSSNYAIAPGSLLTESGTPYKVFTPFFRQWLNELPAPAPAHIDIGWGPRLRSDPIADGPDPTAGSLPPAGEHAAWNRFERFRARGLHDFDSARNLPGVDGTSCLSPYLKWGSLHPLQMIERLGDGSGEHAFVRQLAWRDFYAGVLFDRPDSARNPYVPGNAVEADTDPDADQRFDRWSRGLTGFPIVDAGMRQLVSEGWMHNRVRMITASFLVKDLHLPWRWGARFFMHHLVDGDLASNNHGWQWVAGTGTDASPYYRVFNPTTQSRKFDPEGDYLRRWVPEIAHLRGAHLHDPSSSTGGGPSEYPAPIVDHARARAEALARYERRAKRR